MISHKGYQTTRCSCGQTHVSGAITQKRKEQSKQVQILQQGVNEKNRLTRLPMNARPVLGTHHQPKQKPRQNRHITYHRQTESYHRQQGSATSNSCQPQKRLPPATHCLLEDSNGAVNHLGYNLLHCWVKYLRGIRRQSAATASALRHQTIKSMTINTNCPEWL